MEKRYYEESPEVTQVRAKAIDALINEEFSEYLNSVVSFLNRNGYITELQYLAAMKVRVRSIFD